MASFAFAMTSFALIGALMAFPILLEVNAIAQQQQTIMHSENHHPNNGSNQSSISSKAEQPQDMIPPTVGSETIVISNQTFTSGWMSLVDDVKVSDISIIDNEHIAINLSYGGEGEPPGVSIGVAITNSSSSNTTIFNSAFQNSATSSTDSSIHIMQSGSNYLDAGWQVQHPNSATILVQLDGEILQGGHMMVTVFPFLHH